MKKNWFLRIGLIALVLTIATTCLVGGTFAKYTTTVSGNDTIQVARFGFVAKDGTGEGAVAFDTPAVAVDLFADSAAAVGGTVADFGTGVMLAPGVFGGFVVVLDNSTSDVDVELASAITVEIAGDADEFSSVDFNTNTDFLKYQISDTAVDVAARSYSAASSLTAFADAIDSYVETNIETITKSNSATFYVYYIWESGYDTLDTAIGNAVEAYAGNVNVKVTIEITASQIMTADGD